jgi:4'-phosphopantetheinyl transferase
MYNNSLLSIRNNEIHLWTCNPESIDSEEQIRNFSKLLSTKELNKISLYRFKKDQHLFIITRAFIRIILSKYSRVSPDSWVFKIGEKGKPEIDYSKSNDLSKIKFNISHTENLIICGITKSNSLGVDVEHCYPRSDVLSIANQYFSTSEIDDLNDLPISETHNRFFDYWTLKESYIKACGMGLYIPLKNFSFKFNDKNSSIISIHFSSLINDNPEFWSFWILNIYSDYKVAIAIKDIKKISYKVKLFKFH